MPTALTFLPLLAALALFAVAGLAHRQPGGEPHWVLRASSLASALALSSAAASAVLVVLYGPATSPLFGVAGLGLALRLDALSVTLLTLVAFVGAVVLRYSRNYLAGDPRHGAFLGGLCLTLGAVLLLVSAGNLLQLVLAWIGTSLALQRLLLFYAQRREAVLAARKKFLLARLADLALVAGVVALAQSFGSADIAVLAERAAAATVVPAGAHWAAGLLVLAALLKSAQFPAHVWLPDMVETPTPVSALLHAGVINAGGFLVLRLADVVALSVPSLAVLALVGGFTALFGSLVMLTRSSVKAGLAYSTIAQMGFMLFQCGIGAYTLALLHLVAHSLYKAHAFLSSGGVVERVRATAPRHAPVRPVVAMAGLLSAVLGFVGVAAAMGVGFTTQPAVLTLGGILLLGLAQWQASAWAGGAAPLLVLRSGACAAAAAALYLALEHATERLFAGALPATGADHPLLVGLMLLALLSFALVSLTQLLGPVPGSPFWQAAYVHISNGFYVNALYERLLGAPRRAPGVQS